MEKYLGILTNPPTEARGWTRWWWYGCAVTKEEITRHLEIMHKACIGGVEIQVLYPLHENDSKKRFKNIDYFSPEFFVMIEHTVEEAERLGMGVDFTLGSCWPYGGPFITREMAPQSVIPYQVDICGPCKYSMDFTTKITGSIIGAVMGRMDRGKMTEGSIIDIREKIKPKYLFNWQWGEELEALAIPEGDWKIVIFAVAEYRQTIPAAAPNAGGYAIDHCRKDISEYYFRNAGTPLVERIGKGRINAFFCDSIEVAGHNWTQGLFSEFRIRRGYDLEPYIYALWGEVGDITSYVRYDYYRTMSELTLENFFNEFAKWCSESGSKSRIQAHGTWGDILKAYAAADIPEGETFGEHDKLAVNSVHRRIASSAAHIYGKPVVSNESFTWLRMPRFTVTLENMKAAVDAIFLDGMNMIVNHGYSYSPESAGEPGWAFYASTHICHTNTWWPYYRYLAEYVQRVSAFLRLGRNVAEVGIYLPQADVWSENQLGDLHLAMKLEEYIGRDVADNISREGFWFDYLNDEAINTIGTIGEGGLLINENIYRVIILPGAKRIPLDTLYKLEEFTAGGGILIAAECVPGDGCGLISGSSDRIIIRDVVDRIFSEEDGIPASYGKGCAIWTKDKYSSLTDALNKVMIPDARITENKDRVGYIHRKVRNEGIEKEEYDDIYFISNISDGHADTVIEFKNGRTNFCILDPMNGTVRNDGDSGTLEDGLTYIKLQLEPYGSVIVVFSGEASEKSADTLRKPGNLIESVDISGGWEFSVPEKNYNCHMDKVHTWESIEELRYFSGEGVYSKTISIDSGFLKSDEVILEFEKVHEAAEVYVNGIRAGVLWKSPRKLDIKDFIHEGENVILVKTVNLWINAMIDPQRTDKHVESPVIREWPYFSDVINHITAIRLDPWREKMMVNEPLASGIGGKISLSVIS